jgi:hypothetical protein
VPVRGQAGGARVVLGSAVRWCGAGTGRLRAGWSGGGGGGEETPAASSSSSAATTSAAATPTQARLGEVDVFTCQSFVADADAAYGWLTTLEQQGSISGDLGTPGYLQVYQLGGTASLSAGQQESPQLRAAVQDVADEGKALRAAIDAQGSVSPTPLRQALDDAAEVCETGGFVIDWYEG